MEGHPRLCAAAGGAAPSCAVEVSEGPRPRARERESSVARRDVTEGGGEGNERGRKGIYSLGFFRWVDLGRRSAWAELLYNINEIIQLNIPFSFYFRMKILQLKLHVLSNNVQELVENKYM